MSRASTWNHKRDGLKRMQRATNIALRREGNKEVFDIPGFKYDDFDRTGYLSVPQLLRYFTYTLKHPECSSNEDRLRDHGVIAVVLGMHCSFSPQLYRLAALDLPMILTSSVARVGATSQDRYYSLETADSTRAVLATVVHRLVCMDIVKGTSAPFPDSVKSGLYSVLSSSEYRFPLVKVPMSIPAGTFASGVHVRFSDLDTNFHTSYTLYVKFSLECGSQAAAAGYYSRIRDDIAFYQMKSLSAIYLGESFAGDELNISTWQDSDNAMLLHFVIEKQKRMIFYMNADFGYDIRDSKL